MRRSVVAVVSALCVAAVALVPGAAFAARHHHRNHHQSSHKAKIRHLTFGSLAGSGTTGATGTTGTTGPVTGPQVTVQAFSGGVLTLMLTDGSTVAGSVGPNTQIQCPTLSPSMGDDFAVDGGPSGGGDQGGGFGGQGGQGGGDQGGQGGQGGGDDQGDQGPTGTTGMTGATGSTGPQGGPGDDNNDGDDGGQQGSCGVSSLTPGAVVLEANLAITSTGKTWELLILG
jgi:hypothetical protein